MKIAKQTISKKDLFGSFLTKKKAPIDLILFIIIILITGILLRVFHVSDRLLSSFSNLNYNIVIELLIVFFITIIGFIIFTKRRFNEHKEDLEEWMNLDHKLHLFEKKFENIIYNVQGIAIYGIGKDHSITYWNQACVKMFGFKNSEVIGKKIEDLIVPDSNFDKFKKDITKYYESNIKIKQGEIEYLHKDRSTLNVLTSFHKHESIFGKQVVQWTGFWDLHNTRSDSFQETPPSWPFLRRQGRRLPYLQINFFQMRQGCSSEQQAQP